MDENIGNLEKLKINKLNNLQANIISWYKFVKFNSILVIGEINNGILSFCFKKFNKVCVVEKYVSDELKDNYSNLKIFSSIDYIDEKFDYIILIKSLDNNQVNAKNAKIINDLKLFLNDDGKLLLIENNQLGAANLLQNKYYGFSKQRLDSILEEMEFEYYRYYYVLPRIEQVNVIFSDKYLPLKNDLRRNVIFSLDKNNYVSAENEIFYYVIDESQEKFKECANCFFIECSNDNNLSDVNAVFYNNIRPEKYRLRTLLYDEYAIKENVDEVSKGQLENVKKNIKLIEILGLNSLDSVFDNYIKSKILLDSKRFDVLIEEIISNKGLNDVINQINDFKIKVLLKLQKIENINIFKKYNIDISEEKNQKLTYVKHGFWDLVFQNVFVKDNKYYLYDQEWYEENVPIEFIEYRSIELINGITQEMREELYKIEGIFEYKSEFVELEKAIQKDLSDPLMLELYFNSLASLEEMIKSRNEESEKELEQNEQVQNNSQEIIKINEQNQNIKIRDELNNNLKKNIGGSNETNFQNENISDKKCKEESGKKRSTQCNDDSENKVDRFLINGKKTVLKFTKKSVKLAYGCMPKKIKRILNTKAKYSRSLSKLTGIPMISSYANHVQKLVSNKSNVEKNVICQTSLHKKIGIHLHLYYVDLAHEFYCYLKNIPYEFDLYISIRENVSTQKIKEVFQRLVNLNHIEVVESHNGENDFCVMLYYFSKKLKQYDYIMHIYSKKSLNNGDGQDEWRKYLLDNLLGSEERIMKYFYLMENDNIGLVYPDTIESLTYWTHTWLNYRSLAKKICSKLNIKFERNYLEYSAGRMFWAKKDAILPLLDLYNEIEEDTIKENGQLDIIYEKIIGLVTRSKGYDIAIYNNLKDMFLLNYGEKNLSSYYNIRANDLYNELLKYDVITFDIFDTLITRKVYDIDDIFRVIDKRLAKENILDNFFEIRIKSRENLRRKKETCTIHEIYEEFEILTNLSREQVKEIKKLEIQTELDFCIPKIDVLKLYNKLLKAKKKIILVSDMYFTKDILEEILNNCGYYNYDDIFVSSEIGKTKESGDMWEYFFEFYNGVSTVHIGDNEESDIRVVNNMGRKSYHLMKGNSMYQLSQYNIEKEFNFEESIIFGSVINKGLFNSPFGFFNRENTAIINNEFSYGYCILGPLVLEYIIGLIKVLNENNDGVLFDPNEVYYINKFYTHIIKRINGKGIETPEVIKYIKSFNNGSNNVLSQKIINLLYEQLRYFDKKIYDTEKKDFINKVIDSVIVFLDDMIDVFGSDILKLNIDETKIYNIYNGFELEHSKMNEDMTKFFKNTGNLK